MRHVKALLDGHWHDRLRETETLRARLARATGFDDRVTAGRGGRFPAEPGRYHLYASYACPWAHRAILYRSLKGLEAVLGMSVLHPRWAGRGGWRFAATGLSSLDGAGGRHFLHEVYRAARADYTGRVTVPVLWDTRHQTIVSNDSQAIMRMLDSAFDAWGDARVHFYPRALRGAIDELNGWLLPDVCRGVYRAGFARSQADYEQAVLTLFARLDDLEARLAEQPFLLGHAPCESDWHLFATLCRFDAVYHGAFRCNLRRLIDYPALSRYARRLHEWPGVAQTVRLEHVKRHYYDALGEIDPRIVPLGPVLDYRHRRRAPATRDRVSWRTRPGHRGTSCRHRPRRAVRGRARAGRRARPARTSRAGPRGARAAAAARPHWSARRRWRPSRRRPRDRPPR